MKSLVIDFKKNKLLLKEVGKNSIVFHCYFFTIWVLDKTFLDSLRASHESGHQKGKMIHKN